MIDRRAVPALALVLLVSACPAPEDAAPGPEATPREQPRSGGTLRVALAGDVDSLDPHLAARPSSWWFARALHRGLYAYPDQELPGGTEPVPDLAEEMPEVSDDGRTVRIRLRSGARFGEPAAREVTAADARASLDRLLAVRVGIAPHLGGGGAQRRIEQITTEDDRTLVIRLVAPLPDLAWLLAHPQAAVVPADSPPPPARPARISPAGPYRLEAYRPERDIVLVRNDAWRRADDPVRGAWVDGIEARIGVAPDAALAEVIDGELDLIVDPGPPDERPPAPRTGVRVAQVSTGCVRYLFMDRRIAPFGRAQVRRAVAHALDRAAFVGDRPVAPAPRILPPTVVGHATGAVLAEDSARARDLLSEAEVGVSATIVVGDSERDRAEGSAVRAALARAGIEVQLRAVPSATLYPAWYDDPRVRTTMGIATWCAAWPGLAGRGVLGALAAPGSLGREQTSSRPHLPAIARRVEAALRASSEEQPAAWRTADAALVRTAVLVPLGWPAEEVVLGGRVEGWIGAPMFPRGDPTGIWMRS